MKRWIVCILAVAMLLTMAGCGKKRAYIDSGDEESLYPYGWRVNDDWSVTFKIDGKWDADCVWRAEYDETVLTCETGKKGNTFTVRALEARGTDFALCLYRGDATPAEYVLSFYVQGDAFGGVSVLDCGHSQPVQDGEYAYTTDEEGRLLFCIHTGQSWSCRTVYPHISVELVATGADELTFGVEADPNAQGTVELYCDALPLLLEVDVAADAKGVLSVSDVRQRTDTAFSRATLARLWENLSFTPMLPDTVEVVNGRLCTEETYPFPRGDMKLDIGGAIYDYSVSLSEEWIADYYIRDEYDERLGLYTPAPVPEVTEIAGITVSLYAEQEQTTAVWKDCGVSYALEGFCDRDTLMGALRQLLGG